MGYKSIIQILLILAIISTICISIMKPKMHKPVIVYNSQISFETGGNSDIDAKNLPVMVQNTTVSQNDSSLNIQNQNNGGGISQIQTNIENANNIGGSNNNSYQVQNINFPSTQSFSGGFKNTGTGIKTSNITPKNTKVNQTNTRVVQSSTGTKNIKTSNNGTNIDLNKIVQNNQKIMNTPADYNNETPSYTQPAQNKQTAKPIQHNSSTVQQKTQTQTEKPSIRLAGNTSSSPQKNNANTQTQTVTLTAQEEEIAWNKWRSNLNNQIMKDSKLPAMPNGIVFKYKFTVDKYGKVTNVQTSSTTPGYTPYAIQFIAPVIRSYQGRSILNFPAGSRRVTTTVSGAWRISNTSKYSTPNDYHDIEKVKN